MGAEAKIEPGLLKPCIFQRHPSHSFICSFVGIALERQQFVFINKVLCREEVPPHLPMQLREASGHQGVLLPRTQIDCRIGGWRLPVHLLAGRNRSDLQLQPLPLGPGPWQGPCV